jgi:hypothetical protein
MQAIVIGLQGLVQQAQAKEGREVQGERKGQMRREEGQEEVEQGLRQKEGQMLLKIIVMGFENATGRARRKPSSPILDMNIEPDR